MFMIWGRKVFKSVKDGLGVLYRGDEPGLPGQGGCMVFFTKCKVTKTFYFCHPRSNDSEEGKKFMKKKHSLISASNSDQPSPQVIV